MTIQKEDLELFKIEKEKELKDVEDVFYGEESIKIERKVSEYRAGLYDELSHEIALRKASINGELAAIDRLIAKLDEPAPVVEQL